MHVARYCICNVRSSYVQNRNQETFETQSDILNNHCQLFFWYSWAFIRYNEVLYNMFMCVCCTVHSLFGGHAHPNHSTSLWVAKIIWIDVCLLLALRLISFYCTGHWTPYQKQFQYVQMVDANFVEYIHILYVYKFKNFFFIPVLILKWSFYVVLLIYNV